MNAGVGACFICEKSLGEKKKRERKEDKKGEEEAKVHVGNLHVCSQY